MATSNEKARNAASAERRADIVAAARELYEEQGLSKTSVQDITNRMGVARSLFYHYFPDKEAVTSAVLDDYVADFIEATRCTRYASSTSTRRSTCSSWASSATCERIRTSTTRC